MENSSFTRVHIIHSNISLPSSRIGTNSLTALLRSRALCSLSLRVLDQNFQQARKYYFYAMDIWLSHSRPVMIGDSYTPQLAQHTFTLKGM
jgi:hypothetical protein